MAKKKRRLAEGFQALEEEAENRSLRDLSQALDETGAYHIVVSIPSKDDLYDPYSAGKDLAEGVYSWVERRAKEFPVGAPLAVDFLLPEELLSEQALIGSLFRDHYLSEYALLKREERRMRLAIASMVALGSAFLIGASLVGAYKDGTTDNFALYLFLLILGEILGIGDWVLFWESFDKIFFEEAGRKARRLYLERINSAPLRYLPIESKENL